jgi:maltose/moltooligosaccharide transporter
MEAEQAPTLSHRKALAYSCGNLAAGLFYAFNNFTLPIYLSLYTTTAIRIGWRSSTRAVEQAIFQPLVGAWSDRTWTRIGRRAPFFLASMPIAAVLMLATGLIPHDPAFLLLTVATIFLFSLAFNVGIDPYIALLADVTTPEQRGSVSGISAIFQFVGQVALLVGATFLWSVHPGWVFVMVAVGLIIGFLIVVLGVRERRRHLEKSPLKHTASTRRSFMSFLVYLRHLFSEQREAMKLLGVRIIYQFGINAAMPFLTLFVITEIGTRGWPELVAGVPLLAPFGLERLGPEAISQQVAAVLLLVTGLAALPVGYLGDRVGKKGVFAAGLLIVGVMALLAAGAVSIPQLLVYVFFLGIGNAATTVLFFPLLTDLVPASRVGEFAGLSAFAETGGVVFSVLLAGELINQNPMGLHDRVIFIVTGVCLILGFLAILFVKGKVVQPSAEAAEPAPGPDPRTLS